MEMCNKIITIISCNFILCYMLDRSPCNNLSFVSEYPVAYSAEYSMEYPQ